MSATLSSVLSAGGAVALLTFAICVTDRDEQRPTRDDYDERIADLGAPDSPPSHLEVA